DDDHRSRRGRTGRHHQPQPGGYGVQRGRTTRVRPPAGHRARGHPALRPVRHQSRRHAQCRAELAAVTTPHACGPAADLQGHRRTRSGLRPQRHHARHTPAARRPRCHREGQHGAHRLCLTAGHHRPLSLARPGRRLDPRRSDCPGYRRHLRSDPRPKEVKMLFHTVHDMVGNTPLVRLDLDVPAGTEVYAKLELANPFGMKDRVAKGVIEEARRIGALNPGAPIVESSSGTMALGLALVGRSLGHPVHIVTDPRIDPMTLTKLRSLDVQVHVVSTMTHQGWQGARLERLDELMRELPGAFWPRQYTNPDNPRAYRALAAEITDELGSVDVLVGAVGSGGSLSGSTRALRRLLPGLRSVGVDCVGSVLFGQADDLRRLQSGLGNSLSPHNLDRSVIDEVHWLNDHEAFDATRALAREQQIFAGNTSGSVYRVLGDV